jgi:hypothetical protein
MRTGVLRPRRADYELIRAAAALWGVPLNDALRQMLAHCAACWLESDLADQYRVELRPRYDRQPTRPRRPGPTARGATPEIRPRE